MEWKIVPNAIYRPPYELLSKLHISIKYLRNCASEELEFNIIIILDVVRLLGHI
jgi:hypothetical protein